MTDITSEELKRRFDIAEKDYEACLQEYLKAVEKGCVTYTIRVSVVNASEIVGDLWDKIQTRKWAEMDLEEDEEEDEPSSL